MHWNLVHVDLNFLQNANKAWNLPNLQEDVLENITDVQEDVWEKHVDLVQKLNVQENQPKLFAEEDMQEDAEDFKTEE